MQGSPLGMRKRDLYENLRFGFPQAVTASRVALGGWALFAAVFRQPDLAARLITLGAVTDGLDGPLARRLGVSSDFGSLFDLFADYLCYIVAPVVLSFVILEARPEAWSAVLLALPLLAGAVRYSRNALRSRSESFADVGFPGLGTVIYAFFIVTLTHLLQAGWFDARLSQWLLMILVPSLSVLMVTPVRYPKLLKYRWISIPILPGFVVMCFFQTALLSAVTLALGFVYTAASPFFIRQNPGARHGKSGPG